jgi:hypothetical protein
MRAPIQNHIGEKLGFVHLTGLGAGNSDPDRDLLFHQIGQVIIRAVAGGGFEGQVSAGIGPFYPVVNEKQINRMAFGMGNFTKLKTAGCLVYIVSAQDK